MMYRATKALLLVLFSLPAWATDWYVRPSEGTYGTSDGTSYANAFDGASDIVWGSIAAGDTLWYCGTWNNTEGHGPGAAGSAGNPITMRGDGFENGKCGTETTRASIRRTSAGVFPFGVGAGDNYVTIKGFYFAGSSQGTADYSALLRIEMTGGTITDVIVEDNIFDGSTDDALGILVSPENRANDITNLTIRNNIFQNFDVAAAKRDAIRIVPKTLDGSQNSLTDCIANVGHPVNLVITGNKFHNAKQSVRMQNLEGNEADYTSCMAGRTEGFLFTNNVVTGMRETNLQFDCKSGFPCIVSDNYFGVVGDGTYDKANNIQTGKADGAIIEDNIVMGVVNDGTAGDGVGIIVDHAGIYRSLQSDGVIVRRNFITNNKSNIEACGISNWSADNTQIYANIVTDSTNGICMTGDATGGSAATDNTGVSIFNNTIVDSIDEGLEISRASEAFTFYNNLIVGGQWAVNIETGSTAPTDANNNYVEFTTAQVGGTGTYSPAASTTAYVPNFVGSRTSTEAASFALRPSSELIGAGSPVVRAYDFNNKRCGNPSNIGAFCTGYQDTRSSYSIRTDY